MGLVQAIAIGIVAIDQITVDTRGKVQPVQVVVTETLAAVAVEPVTDGGDVVGVVQGVGQVLQRIATAGQEAGQAVILIISPAIVDTVAIGDGRHRPERSVIHVTHQGCRCPAECRCRLHNLPDHVARVVDDSTIRVEDLRELVGTIVGIGEGLDDAVPVGGGARKVSSDPTYY